MNQFLLPKLRLQRPRVVGKGYYPDDIRGRIEFSLLVVAVVEGSRLEGQPLQ